MTTASSQAAERELPVAAFARTRDHIAITHPMKQSTHTIRLSTARLLLAALYLLSLFPASVTADDWVLLGSDGHWRFATHRYGRMVTVDGDRVYVGYMSNDAANGSRVAAIDVPQKRVIVNCDIGGTLAHGKRDDHNYPTIAKPEVWLCAEVRIADLLQRDAEWPFVKQHLTGIKLYIGQLSGSRRRPADATSDRLRQIVRLVKAHDLKVAVELGGCLDFSPLDDSAGEWSARRELAAIENFYSAGGKVDFLDIDGPIRRLMHPNNRRDGRSFDSIEKAADELIDALRIHREVHPETRYWLLTNFPNWGWRGDVSYHARGPKRQDYGDYDQVVRIVLDKLKTAGIALDGVTVDNPFDYLTGEHRSVKIPDPKSVNWHFCAST